MTLFGVGAVGIAPSGTGAGAQGGGTTLGRIGYGYLYPNLCAHIAYSPKPGEAQLSVALFQPSALGSGGYVFTKIPRVEAEVTYNHRAGRSSYSVWSGGLWQSTSNAATGGNTLSSVGGTAGIKAGLSDLSIVVSV